MQFLVKGERYKQPSRYFHENFRNVEKKHPSSQPENSDSSISELFSLPGHSIHYMATIGFCSLNSGRYSA